MKPLFYVLLLFTSSYWLQSQDASAPPRPVVNADIVEMSRAGLLPTVLIAKIKTSQCKFDTSPSALVALKEAGVADDVLMEMVRNPIGGGSPKVEPIPAPSPAFATINQPEVKERSNDNLPEYGDLSEIRKFRRVFVIADDIDSQNLMVNALRQYDGLDIVASPERADLFVAFTQ